MPVDLAMRRATPAMSISKGGRRRARPGAPAKASAAHAGQDGATPLFVLPSTATREALLERGSDRRFQKTAVRLSAPIPSKTRLPGSGACDALTIWSAITP